MSPSCVLSSHLAKQFAASWKEIRHPLEPAPTTPSCSLVGTSYFQRAGSPTSSDDGKRSLDNDRSNSSGSPMTRTASNSSWKWGGR